MSKKQSFLNLICSKNSKATSMVIIWILLGKKSFDHSFELLFYAVENPGAFDLVCRGVFINVITCSMSFFAMIVMVQRLYGLVLDSFKHIWSFCIFSLHQQTKPQQKRWSLSYESENFWQRYGFCSIRTCSVSQAIWSNKYIPIELMQFQLNRREIEIKFLAAIEITQDPDAKNLNVAIKNPKYHQTKSEIFNLKLHNQEWVWIKNWNHEVGVREDYQKYLRGGILVPTSEFLRGSRSTSLSGRWSFVKNNKLPPQLKHGWLTSWKSNQVDRLDG